MAVEEKIDKFTVRPDKMYALNDIYNRHESPLHRIALTAMCNQNGYKSHEDFIEDNLGMHIYVDMENFKIVRRELITMNTPNRLKAVD